MSFLWPGRIPAFYDIGSKTCYFNTSLTRASKVDDLFVEEVLGHHGFREVLGPERARAFFRNLYEAFKDDPDMPGVIRKYELADVDDYNDLKTEDMTDAQKSEAGEEFGAKLAEESLKPEAQRAPWYERAIFKLRELLRKLFPKLRISRRDLETLLREAAHRLRRGQVRQSETGAGEGGVRFAPYRRPGAPNSATLRGQLRDTNVPAANGFMQWAHLGGKRLYADYEFLYGKHPEYFSSPEEARAVVEFVLFAPEPAQRVGKNLAFVRKDPETGDCWRIEIEPFSRGRLNHIRSAHKITEEKYNEIKVGEAPVSASPPAILPSPNQTGDADESGRWQGRAVSDFLRYNISPSGGKSSGEIRKSVSPVYTGSAADYDAPSLHYVGTGEGAPFSDKDIRIDQHVRYAIEDGDDAPLVEPKPFDPDRDVDYEDPDERAIAVLIPRYGTAAEFDDDEAADYLHGAGFYDVTPQQAHKLVARARETYRKQRMAEIRHNNARRRDDWLYDNVPLYRHAVDFGGKGFKIRMPKDYAHKDDSGTLLAKPNEPGIDLIELAKYIGRVEGRPNEEKEIAEELADFYRECEAVEKFVLVDEHGNKLDVGYDEYMRKKADMRAYLAATQGPPGGDPQTEHAGDDNNIPPVGEKSSGKFYTGATHMSYREQIVRGFFINRLTAFLIAAVGDVNGDGQSDVVLKHDAGFAGCWITQSDYTVAWVDLDTLQDGFTIAGCGDFNGDGCDDVLLQKGSYFGAWYLQAGRPGVGWMGLGDFGDVTVEQIADFNGDNIDDLRLRTAAGDLGAHLVRGEDSTMWAYYGSVGSEWSTSLASI